MTQREAEDLTQNLWQLIKTICNSASLPNLRIKQEQLDLINESIKRFEDSNVPVPEDLPELRTTLMDEMEEGKKEQDVLSFLKEQISQMLATIDAKVGSKNASIRDSNTASSE